MSTGGYLGAGLGGLMGIVFPGVGFFMGAYLGYAIGTMIDPPKSKVQSSPLESQDLTWNTFQRNMPVPIVYGQDKVYGEIIFIGTTRSEVTETDVEGGKGGGNEQHTQQTWYYAEFAMCLAEGELVSVSKVWVDDEDITTKEGLAFVVYLGSSTQAVAPEAANYYPTNSPAWRNTAYLMLSGKLGLNNRLPLIAAEIGGEPTNTETILVEDNFDDNSLDSGIWSENTSGFPGDFGSIQYAQYTGEAGNGSVSETGQQLELTVTGTSASSDDNGVAFVGTQSDYNLTGSILQARLLIPTTGYTATDRILCYLAAVDSSTLAELIWGYDSATNEVFAWYYGDGESNGDFLFATYNPSTMIYFRIREDSGTIYWDYSGDGSTWTNYFSCVNVGATITSMSAWIGIESDCSSGVLNTTLKADDFKWYISGEVMGGLAQRCPPNIIYDLLTNTRYGLGISSSYIDLGSFNTAKSYCDTEVAVGEARFELDITINSERPAIDWIQDMLATFGGYLIISAGKIKLRIDKAGEASVANLDEDHIVVDSFSYAQKSMSDRYNKIEVEFINRDDDYRHDYVVADNEYNQDLTGIREKSIQLFGIKRKNQAQRMAQYYLDSFMYCVYTCELKVDLENCGIEPGDIVSISHSDAPWSGYKTFRVVKATEEENDTYKLSCVEYATGIHHDGRRESQTSRAQDITEFIYGTPEHVTNVRAYDNGDTIRLMYALAPSPGAYNSTLIYKKVDSGDYVYIGKQVAVCPTAYLSGDISDSATSINVVRASGDWANTGTILINDEQITYGSFNDVTLTSCARGANSTTNVSHTFYNDVVTVGKIYTDQSGDLVDRTTDFTSAGTGDVVFFESGDSWLYIGAASRFGRLDAKLLRKSSVNVLISGDYSVGSGDWDQLYFTDGTDGFSRDGCITWDIWQQQGWALNSAISGNVLIGGDSTPRYYVRFKRKLSWSGSQIAPIESKFNLYVPTTITNITNSRWFEYDYPASEAGHTLTFKLVSQSAKYNSADSTTAPTVSIIPSGS